MAKPLRIIMKPLLYLGCPVQFWARQFFWEIWIKPEIPLWSKIWVSLTSFQLEGNYVKTKCFHEFFIILNSSHDFCVKYCAKKAKKIVKSLDGRKIWASQFFWEIRIKPETHYDQRFGYHLHRFNWKVIMLKPSVFTNFS